MDIDDHFARAPLTNCLEHRADVFHQRRASLKSDCQSRRDLPVFQERVPRILVADFLSMIRLVPRIVRRPANRDGRQESVAILVHRKDMVLIPFLRMRRDHCRWLTGTGVGCEKRRRYADHDSGKHRSHARRVYHQANRWRKLETRLIPRH